MCTRPMNSMRLYTQFTDEITSKYNAILICLPTKLIELMEVLQKCNHLIRHCLRWIRPYKMKTLVSLWTGPSCSTQCWFDSIASFHLQKQEQVQESQRLSFEIDFIMIMKLLTRGAGILNLIIWWNFSERLYSLQIRTIYEQNVWRKQLK